MKCISDIHAAGSDFEHVTDFCYLGRWQLYTYHKTGAARKMSWCALESGNSLWKNETDLEEYKHQLES